MVSVPIKNSRSFVSLMIHYWTSKTLSIYTRLLVICLSYIWIAYSQLFFYLFDTKYIEISSLLTIYISLDLPCYLVSYYKRFSTNNIGFNYFQNCTERLFKAQITNPFI